MANAIVSHPGQANASGALDNLFLKVYAGEVLTSFEKKQVTMDKHLVRTITHGKSASFPVMGRASAYYHTPGEEILGGKIKHNERILTIDDLLISPTFIANIEEAKNHYDYRSTYTSEQGNELANSADQHVLQTGVLAARSAKLIDDADQFGGTTIYNVDPTDGDSLAEAMFKAAQVMDEKDVPEDQRTLFVRPEQFYAMARSTKVLNRDWGGEGSYAGGNVIRVAGITIVKTNNLPKGAVGAGTKEAGTGDKYAGDFSNTCGLIMHPSAVGTVKLLDLALEDEYQVSRQGTLMVAKYAMGHGILRGEAAVELSTASAP
ncbi:phage capsid protein [Endozoicomonas ascidiicola]|uniref:phage capsid protein n=1 Tax=Endozoicomonas ascidiicola TaxID=1698521 RepID=UPI00082DFF1C|nr:phage capsid protein [Endozoicomonas ascidiicola]